MPLVAPKHPAVHLWEDERGQEQSTRFLAVREDTGGSEGYPAERLVGGRWDRRYRAWADAFDREPREEERVVDGIDNAELIITSVEHEQLPPHAGILSLLCRRTGAVA